MLTLNKTIKYSIIIPTRERHETLVFAVRSCLAIRRDDIEVVVCDNASSPETKQVVDSFGSDRLRYIRSEKRLNMAENWELAISSAQGEFITVIGDDDGVVPEVLQKIDVLLETCKVVAWHRTPYYWPNYKKLSNVLNFTTSKYEKIYDGTKSLEYVLYTFCSHMFFPSLYSSFVHKDLISIIRVVYGGKLFPPGTISPDVYSALSIMAAVDKYCLISSPFSLSGISRFSNGAGSKKEVKKFIKEYGVKKAYELYSDKSIPRFHDRYGWLAQLSDYLLFVSNSPALYDDAFVKHMVGSFILKYQEKLPRRVIRELLLNYRVNLSDVSVDAKDGIGSYLPDYSAVQVDSHHYGITDVCKAAEVYGQLLQGMPLVYVKPQESFWARLYRVLKKTSSSPLCGISKES